MLEIRQNLMVKDHKVIVKLPKDFNYKQVNIVISPILENNKKFSFELENFEPVELELVNIANEILSEERNLKL